MVFNEEAIIAACIRAQLLTHEEFKHAQEKKPEGPLLDFLIAERLLNREDIAWAAALHYGMEYVDLSSWEVSPSLLSSVPKGIARRYRALPLRIEVNRLIVAISDPSNLPVLDALRSLFEGNVEFVCVASHRLEEALSKYYGDSEEFSDRSSQNGEGPAPHSTARLEGPPIINILSNLFVKAYERHASDIHLEPMKDRFRIRLRIDGVLQETQTLPSILQTALISRLKILSGQMNIAEKRLPQDGRIRFQLPQDNSSLDLRISILPTLYGESAVIRLLDASSLSPDLSHLGLFNEDQIKFEKIIHSVHGMVLITGPTGSGKTTTLYACLHSLNQPERKLITVEDPIEYQIPGINQVPVNPEIGMTFPAALRAILRQAPNVLMIGEIRDRETAQIAIHASLTGHLIFSTLHTNDAPSAVARLFDLGIPPFLVASSVQAIIAQRLVRLLCPNCKQPSTLHEYERQLLNLADLQGKTGQPMAAVGCPLCNGKGFKGRIGIFEIFVLDDEARHLIHQSASSAQLAIHAQKSGMRTFNADGARKVLAGWTTAQEVIASQRPI